MPSISFILLHVDWWEIMSNCCFMARDKMTQGDIHADNMPHTIQNIKLMTEHIPSTIIRDHDLGCWVRVSHLQQGECSRKRRYNAGSVSIIQGSPENNFKYFIWFFNSIIGCIVKWYVDWSVFSTKIWKGTM